MMTKRILLFVLLLALALLLAACAGNQAVGEPVVEKPAEEVDPVEEAAPTEEAEPVEATEPTEEAMEEMAEDPLGMIVIAPDDPIKIASALVIAGPNETLGVDSQRGVEIAIDDRGTVAGHPVELQAEDGGCSAEGGQTAATKIASDESIVAVVGHNCSSSCTPAAPIYDGAGLTMISPSCTAPSLTGEGSHVMSLLRTAHNDNVQGRVMAEFVFNELGLRSAATIHDGSPYAEQLQQVFAEVFVELGGTITAQEAINVGDTDMRPVLTSIATGSPEIIYYPIFIAEGGFITTQAQEISGLEDTVLAGADGMISPDFIAAAGDAAELMYISGPDLAFAGGKYEGFLASHEAKYGEAPLSAFHAHAYDAANMIFDAIEAVATQDGEGNTVIGRQALRDALYATANFEGITGNLACNALGDCADPRIAVNQIQAGAYTPVYQSGEIIGDIATGPAPLPLAAEPYLHPSEAFSFTIPEGWMVISEDQISGLVGDETTNSLIGAAFFDTGEALDEASLQEFIDFIANSLLTELGDDFEILEQSEQPDQSIYIAATYSSAETVGDIDFFFDQRDRLIFLIYFATASYKDLLPTWNEILTGYTIDPEAALAALPEPTPEPTAEPTAEPAPEPTPIPEPVEHPFAPQPGRSRLYVFNEFGEDITFDIAGQAITIPPGTPDDAQPIDLDPGKYTYTISIPGGAVNGEVELGPDQSWVVGVRGDGVVYNPGQIYP